MLYIVLYTTLLHALDILCTTATLNGMHLLFYTEQKQ